MYETVSRVAISDVDADGYMSIGALSHRMHDCCSLHCEDAGYGLKWLQEHHAGWYIVSWQGHILKELPFMGEEITTRTIPYYLKGYLGNRNFLVFDSNGEPIVEANSNWVLMDLKNGRPYRLPREMIDAFTVDEELPIDWPIRKIKADEDRKKIYDFTVSPMHVDTNSHMNNSHYVEAAKACLQREDDIKEMYVDYKAQARLGDKVTASVSEHDNDMQITLEDGSDEIYACVNFVRRTTE